MESTDIMQPTVPRSLH